MSHLKFPYEPNYIHMVSRITISSLRTVDPFAFSHASQTVTLSPSHRQNLSPSHIRIIISSQSITLAPCQHTILPSCPAPSLHFSISRIPLTIRHRSPPSIHTPSPPKSPLALCGAQPLRHHPHPITASPHHRITQTPRHPDTPPLHPHATTPPSPPSLPAPPARLAAANLAAITLAAITLAASTLPASPQSSSPPPHSPPHPRPPHHHTRRHRTHRQLPPRRHPRRHLSAM